MAHVRFIHSEPEALGIEYLSAVLKQAGHTTDMAFDFHAIFGVRPGLYGSVLRKAFVRRILHGRPDLLAFAVIGINVEWAFDIAATVKEYSNIPVVFGGVQPTLIPEAVLSKKFIDFVVVGEGEGAFVDLVAGLARGEVDPGCKNIWMKKDGCIIRNPVREPIGVLDELPFPDKTITLDPLLKSGRYSMITARGCVGCCSYCCTPTVRQAHYAQQPPVRRRSPENALAELIQAKEKYRIRRVFFEDEIFTYDKAWLSKFAALYQKEIALPSVLCSHVNFVDEEIVACLRVIQCVAVEMGVESLNPRVREQVLGRQYTHERVVKSLGMLKAAGISVMTENIVGLPGEQPEDVLEMVRFYNALRPGKVSVHYLRYFPMAKITQLAGALPEGALDCGHGYVSLNKGDRQQMAPELARTNRLLLVLTGIYWLPRWVIRLILDKKWYEFLPALGGCYRLNELIFYFACLFSRRGRRAILQLRGTDWLKMRHTLGQSFSLCLGRQE